MSNQETTKAAAENVAVYLVGGILHASIAGAISIVLILCLFGGQTKAQNLQEVGDFVQKSAAEARGAFKCYQTGPFVYAKVSDDIRKISFAVRLGTGVSGLKTICAKGLLNAIRVGQGINGNFAKISILSWHAEKSKYTFGYSIPLLMRDGEPNGFSYGNYYELKIESFTP
jgi:hypothetical protein